MLHILSAAAKSIGYLGFKAYTTNRRGNRFHVTLYDGKSGEMVALMQADYLGQMRTGAASAVATKHLSRPDSATLGIFGTGLQARTQVLGVCAVRNIGRIHVWSRNTENRTKFAEEMTRACAVQVIAAKEPSEAAGGLDIVCTATTSREPVLKGQWVSPGMHLNIIGSNYLTKSEIDVEAIRRSTRIVIDSKEQGQIEAGDFVAALKQRIVSWSDIEELGAVIAGRVRGRATPQDVTLFKSLGIGLEDIAVAALVYSKAKALTVGKFIEL
jgi:ornithine cyclodeaminase/alanine dehydrogenase-like protein (mu-crystallin family)